MSKAKATVLFLMIFVLPVASLMNVLVYGDESSIEILRLFEEIEAGLSYGLFQRDLEALLREAEAEFNVYLKTGMGKGREDFVLCLTKLVNSYRIELDKVRRGETGIEINVNSGSTYLDSCWKIFLEKSKRENVVPLDLTLKPITID